jgi:hypothetical protein
MNTKYTHPHSPFPYAHLLLNGTHPWKRPILSSCPSFFKKCTLIVQGGFALVLQACIHHALIKLTPLSITYSYESI